MDHIKLKEVFERLGEEAFVLSHYELAERTGVGKPHEWKDFLMHPEIHAWIKSELKIMHEAELHKLLQGISSSNSTGQAQIVGALSRLTEEKSTQKEGPIFIYSYIPLNENQEEADNTNVLDHDPFME